MNTNIVVLTERSLTVIKSHKSFNQMDCLLPEHSVDYLLFEDSNFKHFYAVKQKYLYLYDIGQYCRPIRSYHLPSNCSLALSSQILYLQCKERYFALNLTSSSLKPLTLPVVECDGPSKLNVIRKLSSQYIISQICISDDKLLISHVLVDIQS